MREEVLFERLEPVGDGAAGIDAVVVGQSTGGCFDRVQMVGDRSVLGSEPLDDGRDCGVCRLELVEEVRLFGVMVRVDEAAVAQAADLELPERAVAS